MFHRSETVAKKVNASNVMFSRIVAGLSRISYHDGSLFLVRFNYGKREIEMCFEQDVGDSNIRSLFRESSAGLMLKLVPLDSVRISLNFYSVSLIKSTEFYIDGTADLEISKCEFDCDQNSCAAQFVFLLGFGKPSWHLQFSFEGALLQLPMFGDVSLNTIEGSRWV